MMASVMSSAGAATAAESPLLGAAESPLLGVYRPAAPVFVGGRGCRLYDADGRSYLDFGSGIGVNALGYADEGVANAMRAALDTGLIHTSNLFRTEPAAELAALLVANSFADRVFFCNSGAEANEAAFKFARRWARGVGGAAKHEIVSLRGAFHGRLFGALAATDRRSMQEPFEPLMPGVRFIVPGDTASAAETITADRTAAIIVEPVQGEGGVQPLAPEFLRTLRQLADAADALLIFDEVQCGLGRTGRLFACEASGVQPDLLTLAKPLAGGLPMGATLLTERVATAIQPGDHATTFGGGPLVAAVAREVVGRLADPALLSQVRQTGVHLEKKLAQLKTLPVVTETRGVGLMWGVELTVAAGPVVARALEYGLIVTAAGERVIRLLPPLIMTTAEIDEGVAILSEVLA
ncbi:aspartate aminotransferase family protein [soil metagenome]